MMRRNSYLGLREVEQNLMTTEACGATNCTMMEVGRAISIMMVCGATKSTLKGNAVEKIFFFIPSIYGVCQSDAQRKKSDFFT